MASFPLEHIICSFHKDVAAWIAIPILFGCSITSSIIHSLWLHTIIIPKFTTHKHFFSKYQKLQQISTNINSIIIKDTKVKAINDTNSKQTLLLNVPDIKTYYPDQKEMFYQVGFMNKILNDYKTEINSAKRKYYQYICMRNYILDSTLLDIIFDYTSSSLTKPWYNEAFYSIYLRGSNYLLSLAVIYPLMKLSSCIYAGYLIFPQYITWRNEQDLTGWYSYLSILYCLLYIQPYMHQWDTLTYFLHIDMFDEDLDRCTIWHDVESCLWKNTKCVSIYRFIMITHYAISILFALIFITWSVQFVLLMFFVSTIFKLIAFIGNLLLWNMKFCCPKLHRKVADKKGKIAYINRLVIFVMMAVIPSMFIYTAFGNNDRVIDWKKCPQFKWDSGTIFLLVTAALF